MKKTLIIATVAGLAMSTGVSHFDDEAVDNNLVFADEVADNNLIINKIKDGYYTATNWALQNPDKVHQVVNFGANMLMNPKWDDELVQKNVAPERVKKSHEKKKVVVPEAHDNNLIINKIKDGYYTATNWALQNPHKIQQVVNVGANMLMNPKWDDELMQKNVVQEKLRKPHDKKKVVVPEAHDNNLIINKIKDGYYTATNWALQNPHKIQQVVNVGANMLMNPKWDDELMQKNVAPEKIKKTHEKKKVVVPEAHDNNLIINKIKDGYYTATNWALQNPHKIQQVVNVGANMLMNPKWDDELVQKNVAPEKLKKTHEKKKVVVPEAHDNNLIINKIKDGYYTATNWALQNPHKIQQVVNVGANMLMNPKWDDELSVVEKTETKKSEKPKETHHRRQHTERPDEKIKRNSKLRVLKQAAADNSLFDLADLLQDN